MINVTTDDDRSEGKVMYNELEVAEKIYLTNLTVVLVLKF